MFLLALVLFFLPSDYQGIVRQTVRETALWPFFAVRAAIVSWQDHSLEVAVIRAERDSLAALVAAQAPLAEENTALRSLLELRERALQDFVSAEITRELGVVVAENTFVLNVGADQGVQVGSPVIAAGGLLGIVREVGRTTSLGIYWNHADFRASALAVGTDATGIVETRRGRHREEDLLVLEGAPFHTDVSPGTRVVTSGAGGVFRRGIVLGTVVGIEDADAGWRKSYVLRPAVRPEMVTHVLVEVRQDSGSDLTELWSPGVPDSAGEPSEQYRPESS